LFSVDLVSVCSSDLATRPMANYHYHQPGSQKSVTFVHNKYNSPLGLYSTEEVAETLQRHTRLLGNGAVG